MKDDKAIWYQDLRQMLLLQETGNWSLSKFQEQLNERAEKYVDRRMESLRKENDNLVEGIKFALQVANGSVRIPHEEIVIRLTEVLREYNEARIRRD